MDKSKQIAETTPNALVLQQFENPSNPDVHRRTTGGCVDSMAAWERRAQALAHPVGAHRAAAAAWYLGAGI